jgi:hypothetical protein
MYPLKKYPPGCYFFDQQNDSMPRNRHAGLLFPCHIFPDWLRNNRTRAIRAGIFHATPDEPNSELHFMDLACKRR